MTYSLHTNKTKKLLLKIIIIIIIFLKKKKLKESSASHNVGLKTEKKVKAEPFNPSFI